MAEPPFLYRRARVVVCAAALTTLGTLFAPRAAAQTSLTGGSMVMRSLSSSTMSSSGFVGTYLTVPAGGATVNFTLNATAGATAGANPHVNIVVADSKLGLSLTSTSATDYATSNVSLPAGTYLVRAERDFTGNVGTSRSVTVNNLSINTVGGAVTFNNVNTGTVALAAADSYIQNFRRGAATVSLTGPGGIKLLPGTPVNVDLARHAFNFGTAVPGSSSTGVSNYLGSNNTAQQTNYQAKLLQNFNAVVPENVGKWSSNESTRDVNTMTGVDTILNYAQSHNLRARMHNMIWGSQQPSWATTLLSSAAGGNATAKSDLRTEITERVGYYVGTGVASDRSRKYVDLDVYNESYHTGLTVNGSYWNVYTPAGIADMYREVHAVAPSVNLYVNEYNVYADTNDGTKYANYYHQHTEALRNAGITAGYGDVVSGIGTQYYVNNVAIDNLDPNRGGAPNNAHNPARVMQTMQNLSTQGVPITLTEFGVKSGATGATAAQMLSDSLRVAFGNAGASGFMMWGFQAENGGGNLFAPAAALYNVNTSNWNAWTITEAGKAWQDLVGIQDWDGNPDNGWATHVTPTVDANGNIAFTGFYGDYNVGGGTFNLNLAKGTTSYALSLTAPPDWSMWNVNNSGNWSTSANWTNSSAPNGAGKTAHFGTAGAPRTVTVDGPKTVGMINFDGANGYTLADGGNSTITFQGYAGANVTRINVLAGSHTIAAPVAIVDDLTVDAASGAQVQLSNLQPTAATLTKTGAGTLRVIALRAQTLNLSAGTVSIAPASGSASSLALLSISPSATFDLTDNDLIVSATSKSSIESHVSTKRLTSSHSTPTSATGLGVLDGAEYASFGNADFDGTSVAPTDVLVKYTWNGDANFDGRVTFDDYVRIDTGFGTGLTGWANGDFNYSGSVNFDDYVMIDIAFNAQNGTLARAIGWISGDDRTEGSGRTATGVETVIAHFEQFGARYGAAFLAAVPELGSATALMTLGLVSTGLRFRRRKPTAIRSIPQPKPL